MSASKTFATKLSPELQRQLSAACEMLGLKKSFLVEEAIREKLEELLDAYDLRKAKGEASGFHSWESVKRERK